jgi:hypothetical protein
MTMGEWLSLTIPVATTLLTGVEPVTHSEDSSSNSAETCLT